MAVQKIADHTSLVYVPKFWDPAKAYQDYDPDLEGAYREGVEVARKRDLEPAHSLIKRGVGHAFMAIDPNKDFLDGKRLGVNGANDAWLRVSARALNGTMKGWFAGAIVSHDFHSPQHCSFDTYYRDRDGNPLDLSQHGKVARLALVDPKKALFRAYGYKPDGSTYDIGFYQPKFDALTAVEYSKYLQSTGQGDIWVFVVHCKQGSDGVQLHSLFAEVLSFMEGALSMMTTNVFKGHISTRDWFGPFEPNWPDPSHPQGSLQKDVLDNMKPFKTVEFEGIAEDFCVYHGLRQTMSYFKTTEYFTKLRFVKDGTAPIIPNAAHVVAQYKEAELGGIKFINHDSPFTA